MAATHQGKKSKKKRVSKLEVFFANFTLNKKTRRRLWIAFGIGVLCLILAILTGELGQIWVLFLIPGILLTVYPLGLIIVINEKNSAKNILLIIGLILVGILFKIMHWPGAGVILSLTLMTLGCGYFFLAWKNFFTIKDNTYLRIVGSLAALFISFMSTGMVFKFQHWPGAGLFITISTLPSLIFTMLVLITLPGSGYIKWKSQDKKMFSRSILIPWMFFLLVTATVLLIPKHVGQQIFYGGGNNDIPFNMKAYEIMDVEGLEPDINPDQ